MRHLPLMRAGSAVPIVRFLRDAGAPTERLLSEAGLPAWTLTEPDALVPAAAGARLLGAAAHEVGLRDVGLRAGRDADIESLGLYGRLIRRSATVREAVETILHHHRFFSSNGRLWLDADGDDVAFRQAFTAKFDGMNEGWQQANHYVLMMMLGVLRLGAGPGWRPARVHLQTGPSAALRHADAFAGAELRFSQPSTAIFLPAALLDEPLERRVERDIPEDLLDAWKASAPADEFVRSVAQIIETLSWDGYPDIHLTARVVGMGVRSLQRYLNEAGVTHDALVGEARFATAAALLEETDTKILDIALDLGYSDHAHFTRAFRRWAGCSPQAYRRNHAEGPAASS